MLDFLKRKLGVGGDERDDYDSYDDCDDDESDFDDGFDDEPNREMAVTGFDDEDDKPATLEDVSSHFPPPAEGNLATIEIYGNLTGRSSVTSFIVGKKFILVEFASGRNRWYRYSTETLEQIDIDYMIGLARAGKGLSTFINHCERTRFGYETKSLFLFDQIGVGDTVIEAESKLFTEFDKYFYKPGKRLSKTAIEDLTELIDKEMYNYWDCQALSNFMYMNGLIVNFNWRKHEITYQEYLKHYNPQRLVDKMDYEAVLKMLTVFLRRNSQEPWVWAIACNRQQVIRLFQRLIKPSGD
jgi:hypothetical protein